MTTDELIKLAAALAWPVTTVFACYWFYGPLSRLVDTLGQRVQKFSVFKVDVELGPLRKAVSLEATVESLKKVGVTESGLVQVVASIIKSSSADYVTVNIGDEGEEWLTSRLFLLGAILDRSRAVRCIVFLDGSSHYLGAASPRDVRSAIGSWYTAYEVAFAAANSTLAQNPGLFRQGADAALIDQLAAAFLKHPLITRSQMPAPEPDWAHLDHGGASPPSWEFAHWLTADSLRDLLGRRLMSDAIVAAVGRISPQTMKSLVWKSGQLLALIGTDGRFTEICDRYAVLETLAQQAVELSSDAG